MTTSNSKATDHDGDWTFSSAPHKDGYVLCLLSVEGYQTMALACAPGDEDMGLFTLLKKAGKQ